ncbi:MAG: TerB family tellurite resistance protein [Acidobacteriota bacterium]
MSIWNLFGVDQLRESSPSSEAETESVRKIMTALDHMEADRARFLAAFAYVLGRVARSDQEFSEEETRIMERIVAERGHLSEEQARLVVQIARTQSTLFSGIEDYVVTREFNRVATHDQKLDLIDCLFAVSAANHSISSVEDSTIRQISRELKLRHKEFIDVRLRYRDHLDVLRTE